MSGTGTRNVRKSVKDLQLEMLTFLGKSLLEGCEIGILWSSDRFKCCVYCEMNLIN